MPGGEEILEQTMQKYAVIYFLFSIFHPRITQNEFSLSADVGQYSCLSLKPLYLIFKIKP